MHFFGVLGTLVFLTGGIATLWLIAQKIYRLYTDIPVREIVEQPLFYIALILTIIGVQMFLTGFVAELVSRTATDRNDYLIEKQI